MAKEGSTFFAILSRMKYIERWALMRNQRSENLSEHSLEVAMIAHALCLIGNVRYGKKLHAERAALIGMCLDASEIITGDMPTPVKYYNEDLRDAYKMVESAAEQKLLGQLPEDLKPFYKDLLSPSVAKAEDDADRYLRRLVKAADKLSALLKCIEERRSGNEEFSTAERTIEESVNQMRKELPEVDDFVKEFLPSYGNTLDQLLGR